MSEEKKVLRERPVRTKGKINEFVKKHGFYIGVFLIFVLVIVVMTSDKDVSYSGEINYTEKAFYSDGNVLYLKEKDKDAKLLTANILKEFKNTKIGKVLIMCKISKDQEYIYFFENVDISGENFHGDLCVYHNNKKKIIGENVPLSYALSSDLSKVAFVQGYRESEQFPFSYDLYFYEGNNKKLIDTDIDRDCYTLSGDAKAIIYNKGFYQETGTTSMYIYKNGKSELIDNQAVYFYKLNANGTFKSNWPLTNEDGSKIIYATYGGEGELPNVNIYKAKDKSKTILANKFAQIFVDDRLDKAIINGERKMPANVGELIKYNLNNLSKEVYATNIWGLMYLDVAKYVDLSFFDMNFYLKTFDGSTDTADLYFKGEDLGEEKVLSSVYVDNLKMNSDYTKLYALGYYYSVEGGQLVIFEDITSNSYKVNEVDENVMEYHFDKNHNVFGYRKDIKLYFINKDGEKKMIDNHNVASFSITDYGNLVYFYKNEFDEGKQIGKGDLYIYDVNKNDDYTLIDKNITFIYEYEDRFVAYLTDFSFASETGKLIITDGKNNFEIISESVSTLLMKNFIK